MGAEFFNGDRRKDGRDKADSRVSRSSATAYKIKRREPLFISFLFVQILQPSAFLQRIGIVTLLQQLAKWKAPFSSRK